MNTGQVTPSGIMQLALGFMASKTLLSAVELGVFTTLADGPLDFEALRERTGVHPRSARDFFDALVALGMLERADDGRYANAAAADLYLDRRKPTYIGGLLEMMNARLFRHWASLSEGLKTGLHQNEAKGRDESAFDSLYADPARLENFLAGMTGVSLPIATAIARQFPWRDYGSVIDIGTAQGCLPVQIAVAHAHVKGGGFDLPPVRPTFERYVRSHGLDDRLRFHPGDFFNDPFPSADVLVLGHVLHDWDLPTKRMLLKKAHDALPAGGAVVVYDMMIDDSRRTNVAGLLMSLNMLIETPGGFDYTGADCIGWLREAGFATARVEPLVGPHSMAVGIK